MGGGVCEEIRACASTFEKGGGRLYILRIKEGSMTAEDGDRTGDGDRRLASEIVL